jgi:hypothetical protein
MQKDRIAKILVDYINETGAIDAEMTMQMDDCVLSAPEYIANMVEVVKDIITAED